jgi:hypothetical protein
MPVILIDNHFTIILPAYCCITIYFCRVKLRLLKILSFVLCLAFFANIVESYLHDSTVSVEILEKKCGEKSYEKDLEKDTANNKIFYSHSSMLFPQFLNSHFINEVLFKHSAYLSLPERPPEMI